VEEGPPPDDDGQPLPSEDAPRTEDRTTSKRLGTLVDMHVDHACNIIYAPFCLPLLTLRHLPPLHAQLKIENTALDPHHAGVSEPPAHDYRPSHTAFERCERAISTAAGGNAYVDSLVGTPFALTFPLIARHDQGAFILLSMREVGPPRGHLSLVDDHPCTGLHTTMSHNGMMDCSDDPGDIGGQPTKGGVAMTPSSHHCPDAVSVGPGITTVDSVEVVDRTKLPLW
jgi:hypothetical protein